MKFVSLRIERNTSYASVNPGQMAGIVSVESENAQMNIALSPRVLSAVMDIVATEAGIKAVKAAQNVAEGIKDSAAEVKLESEKVQLLGQQA